MPDPKPTLITEILAGCARVEDGRQPEDIMLRAMAELGELAAEAAIARGIGMHESSDANGVAGKAMDLLICMVDHMRAHDPDIGDAELVAASTTHQPNWSKPFTAIALGWGARDNTTLQHRQSRILECIKDLADLHGGPEEDHHRERRWRHEVGANAVRACLLLIAGERPGITDEELIGMARPRLEAWTGSHAPSAASPEL